MANNKKDDWVDLPLEQSDDWTDLPVEPQEISQTESAIRGAAQEATFGLADELTGIAETGLEAVKGNVPLSASELLKSYQKLRDESRAAYKSAEETNPASYLGGQIVGGIAPAIATGGAAVAGKLAAGAATKVGIGQLMKEGAKSGLKYGLAQGVGKSEAEVAEGELGQLAKDVASEGAIGGVAGGVMPLAAPALKGAAKTMGKAPKAVGSLIKKLPGYDKAAASYEWGKLGKNLTIDDIDPEMVKLGKTILKDVTDAKGSVNIKKAKEVFEQAGIVVDTEQALQKVISDIENIAKSDYLKASKANEVLPLLKQLAGQDARAQKLVDQLEKRMVKQAVQASTKAEQAVIKGEKKLFDQALKSGDEIDSITNLNRSFEDIAEIPTDTSKGTIGGIKANLKRTAIDPETGEDVAENVSKMITSDVTPFQPTAPTLTVDPTTGRTIAVSKDLGTGKVDAIVGEILDNPSFTPDQVPLNDIDGLIANINNFTNIAKTAGGSADPAVRRLQGFAGELRKLQNEAMEQSGLGTGVVEGRKRLSGILEAEKILDIDQPYSAIKSVDEAQKATKLAEQFGYEKGFKGREERRLVEDLLQGDIKQSTLKDADLLRKVNAIVGRTGDTVSGDTISKSSLFQQIVTELPNMAGQGKAAIDKSMRKVGTAISNATPVEIQNMATMLKMSSNKAAQRFAPMVEQAIGDDGKVKKAVLFALYQQPAFREVVKQVGNVEGAGERQPSSDFQEVPVENSPMQVQDESEAPAVDISNLKTREGFRSKTYKDSEGFDTIGYGHKLTEEEKRTGRVNGIDIRKGLTKEQAEQILQQDFGRTEQQLNKVLKQYKIDPNTLSSSQKQALREMLFQLGEGGVSGFKKMLGNVAKGDYSAASKEAANSKWAKQTPLRVQDFQKRIIQK